MSISVSGVTKIYGEQKALNEVSFEVKPGEIVGFLGPNGAGKSTMMKIICGYIPQNKGRVVVCGLDLDTNEMEVKKKLGYLPENNPLYLEMYVREYLEFVAGVYKIENVGERIDVLIKMVGLEVEQHKKIGALSKGYRQRVGLAQAFLHNPEVLILDEPTTGLDPNQIVEIRDLIREIGKDKTVMLSTHIMQEVEAICDRAIIINKGKIVADQPISELKKAKNTSDVLEVEFSEEVSLEDLKSGIQDVEIKSISSKRFEFKSTGQIGLKKKIMQFALDKDLEISALSEDKGSLEDVFRSLTSGK